MAKLLLTYRETADELRLSERKVKELVAGGQLPAVSIGAARRVRASDLEEYVQRLGTAVAS